MIAHIVLCYGVFIGVVFGIFVGVFVGLTFIPILIEHMTLKMNY